MKNMDEVIMDIHGSVKGMEASFSAHINDKSRHQLPPCKFYDGLVIRLWGVFIVGVGGLGTAVYQLFVKTNN